MLFERPHNREGHTAKVCYVHYALLTGTFNASVAMIVRGNWFGRIAHAAFASLAGMEKDFSTYVRTLGRICVSASHYPERRKMQWAAVK